MVLASARPARQSRRYARLMTVPRTEVAEAAERWTSAEVKEWSPRWRETLAAWLETSLALVGDEEWGAQFRDMVRIGVDDPRAWANREIPLSNGHWAIAGIRFRGRDVEKPFVDIIATSLPPDPGGVAALGEVLPNFRAFSPLCLRVNLPDAPQPFDVRAGSELGGGEATSDQLIVARPVTDMLELPESPRYGAVTLAPCGAEDAAQRVATIYRELALSRPKLDQWATPADADSLEDTAREGLLFEIRVDDHPAGIIAASREHAYGLRGFCMQDRHRRGIPRSGHRRRRNAASVPRAAGARRRRAVGAHPSGQRRVAPQRRGERTPRDRRAHLDHAGRIPGHADIVLSAG